MVVDKNGYTRYISEDGKYVARYASSFGKSGTDVECGLKKFGLQ